jgi:hypothetical protein
LGWGSSVPDSTTNAINSFYDLFDKVADGADRVLNHGKRTAQSSARRSKAIDTAPSVKVGKKTAAKRFRIIEAIAAETGSTIFVVTNGTVRAECTTRELAEKILRGLEASP